MPKQPKKLTPDEIKEYLSLLTFDEKVNLMEHLQEEVRTEGIALKSKGDFAAKVLNSLETNGK